MKPPGPPDAPNADAAEADLCREVLEASRRAAADRIRGAERRAAELLEEVRGAVGREVEAHLAETVREAERRRASILASIPMEVRRLEAARREAELEAIRDAALDRLQRRDASERRKSLLAVIPPAVAAMEGTAFVLRMSPADQPLATDDFLGHLGRALAPRAVRLTPEFDPVIPPGGVVIEGEEGRQRWDDTVAARCARLWPELRLRVAAAAGWLPGEGTS